MHVSHRHSAQHVSHLHYAQYVYHLHYAQYVYHLHFAQHVSHLNLQYLYQHSHCALFPKEKGLEFRFLSQKEGSSLVMQGLVVPFQTPK